MRFVEPVIRPRPLLWATAVFGLLLALFAVADPSMSPLSRLLTPLVLPCSLVFLGMFFHAACVIFLRAGLAGPLGCPELLPSDAEVHVWLERSEWLRQNTRLGTDPVAMLVVMAWVAPESISWRDQLALTALVWWRPFPALLVAPVLIGCLLFLAAWEWAFGVRAASNDISP